LIEKERLIIVKDQLPEDRPAEEKKFVFSVVEKRSATRMQLN